MEKKLQITPNPETIELEVEVLDMVDKKDDKLSKEDFSQHLLNAIHDFSKGIDELSEQNNKNNKGNGIQGDIHMGEGEGTLHHHATSPPNVPHVSSTPPKSTIPTFLASGVGGTQGQEDMPVAKYFAEYQSNGFDFREAITFKDFCQLKSNNRSKGLSGGGYMHDTDLQLTMGRLFLPTFDGSPKSSAMAWVEKLDNYFQLNQMT